MANSLSLNQDCGSEQLRHGRITFQPQIAACGSDAAILKCLGNPVQLQPIRSFCKDDVSFAIVSSNRAGNFDNVAILNIGRHALAMRAHADVIALFEHGLAHSEKSLRISELRLLKLHAKSPRSLNRRDETGTALPAKLRPSF